jgi:hypothetical protein
MIEIKGYQAMLAWAATPDGPALWPIDPGTRAHTRLPVQPRRRISTESVDNIVGKRRASLREPRFCCLRVGVLKN